MPWCPRFHYRLSLMHHEAIFPALTMTPLFTGIGAHHDRTHRHLCKTPSTVVTLQRQP